MQCLADALALSGCCCLCMPRPTGTARGCSAYSHWDGSQLRRFRIQDSGSNSPMRSEGFLPIKKGRVDKKYKARQSQD